MKENQDRKNKEEKVMGSAERNAEQNSKKSGFDRNATAFFTPALLSHSITNIHDHYTSIKAESKGNLLTKYEKKL